jgi:hypothetical protein
MACGANAAEASKGQQADDWARKSAAMSSIYTCEDVTIAANRAKGDSHSFFTRPER